MNTNNIKTSNLIYPKESYFLFGLFYYIQNNIGNMLKEKQYADALEIIFKKNKIEFFREKEIPLLFSGSLINGNVVDFIYKNIILIDIKAKKYITREDYRQMIRYLEATKFKLGILVNFRPSKVEIKRIINLKTKVITKPNLTTISVN